MTRYVVMLLLLSLLAVNAYAVPINLQTASTFGLLGGSAVTNTGSSVINGDVGSSPTPAVIGFPPGIVLGTLYTTANAVTAQAQSDLTAAYLAAKGAAPTATLTGVDLGTFNAGNPLGPGVYFFKTSALLTGNLTLDGGGDPNAQWIFQIGTTLTTATNATVSFINGASPCNVFWQVGSSATIQTNNLFAGTIMALASITLDGGTLNGRALARNGAVTISSAEFVNIDCPAGPCVTMAKAADRPVASANDVITYTYEVCNCGPAALTVNSVTDSRLGDLTGDFVTANGGTAILPIGACAKFTRTYTVLVTDTSPLVNSVVVNATSGGVNVSDTAQASVIITTPGPCVTISKKATPAVVPVGGFVTYTFDVCNCGTSPLTVNSVVDSHLGDLTADFIKANGGTSTLGTGLCTSFDEVYTVLPTDLSPLVNSVTVSASSGGVDVSDTAGASITIVPGPCVSIVKQADHVVAAPGALITYTYNVCNCGTEPETVTSVADTRLGDLTANFIAANGGTAILAFGACTTFTKTYTVKVTDTSPLLNSVTVTANSGGEEVMDTSLASVIIAKPSIHVVKRGCRTTARVGDLVTYTITVTNNGNIALTNLVVKDSFLGVLPGFPSTLAVGASVTRKFPYIVNPRTPNPLVNYVTGRALPLGGGLEVSDTDSWSIAILHPGISIMECVDKKSAKAGCKLTYTLTVRNTGDTRLTNIHVSDKLVGELSGLPSSFGPGDYFIRKFTYVITSKDKSPLTDEANVVAVAPNYHGRPARDNNSVSVTLLKP